MGEIKLKVMYFSLIILFCLSLTSCSRSSGQYDVDTIENFRKGSLGLDLDFVMNNPPREILEDSIFAIGLEVHNRGATSVHDAILTLSYDSDYLDLFGQSYKQFDLEGKNSLNPDGEERNYFFEAETKYLDTESSTRSLPIMASVCYQYQSVLTEVMCIGRSYTDNYDSGDPVCDVRDFTYSGQGGPVIVESVKLNILSTDSDAVVKPIFDIVLSHRGQGLVTNFEDYSKLCTSSFGSASKMNLIEVVEAKLSDYPLTCEGKVYSLTDGTVRIRCESLREVNAYQMPFQAPLNLVLNYGYMQSESISVDMVR